MTDTPDGTPPLVQDARRPPFCYQTHDALDAVRDAAADEEKLSVSTAIAVYVSLTETANRSGGALARGAFQATRKDIARRAGVSIDTLDRYIAAFEKHNLLRVLREEVHGVNMPNTWTLLETESVPPVTAPVRSGGSRPGAAQEPKKPLEKKKDLSPIAPRPPNRPATVNRKPVKDAEYDLAAQVLTSFNEQAGTHYGSRDYVAKVVMRIREQPTLTLEMHQAVIAASLARSWWSGSPSPSVVYGNASLFERAVHSAASDSAGDRPMTPDEMRAATPSPHADVEAEAEEVHD